MGLLSGDLETGYGSGLSSKKFSGPYAKFFHSRLIKSKDLLNLLLIKLLCIFKSFGEFKFRA